jgi:hypothetical protein
MRDLFDQIPRGLEANLHYLTLFATLAIPDICGAMQSDDGIATPQKYVGWFDEYVAHRYYGMLTGQDCYYFRCSLLHQGSSQHRRSTYERILFVEPTATTNVFHCNVVQGALNIDIRIFCMDMAAGGRVWLERVEHTDNYSRNYSRFMKRHPDGLSPYIVGVPVVA